MIVKMKRSDLHFPPGTVTVNWSTLQAPRLLAVPAAAVAGPIVTVVTVTGLFRAKVSKSSLNWQTSVEHLQIVREQEPPSALEEEVKYVVFWDTVPEPQDFSKMQQTPNDEAQVPLAVPLKRNNSKVPILAPCYLPVGGAL